MIYIFIGAALFIAAAWVASNHVYNKAIILQQNHRIAKLMGDIRHLENAINSYKDSRDYYKDKFRNLQAELNTPKDNYTETPKTQQS